MKTSTALIIALCIIVGTGYFLIKTSNSEIDVKTNVEAKSGQVLKNTESESVVKNSTIENGIQHIIIKVKGGYTPQKSIAQAGVPTILDMETDGTYDCSSSLVIKSLNVRRTLPNTGVTFIDAGVRSVGDVIEGVCSMGMYSFKVEFK